MSAGIVVITSIRGQLTLSAGSCSDPQGIQLRTVFKSYPTDKVPGQERDITTAIS